MPIEDLAGYKYRTTLYRCDKLIGKSVIERDGRLFESHQTNSVAADTSQFC